HFRGKAFDHDTVAADYSQAGVRDLYEEHRDHASSLHESADLHEHTASVLALILGTRPLGWLSPSERAPSPSSPHGTSPSRASSRSRARRGYASTGTRRTR